MASRIRPWSDEEEQQLLTLVASGKSNTDIATELGRTHHAVANRLLVLRNGGDVTGQYRAKDARCTWTPDQDSLLLLHHGSMERGQLAALVGKSEKAVKNRLSRLRRGRTATTVIPFPVERPSRYALLDRARYPVAPGWSPVDDFRVRLFYGDLPLPELAARLGRTVNAVRARVNHLGWSLDKAIAFRLEVSRSPLWIEALQAMQAMEDNRGDK